MDSAQASSVVSAIVGPTWLTPALLTTMSRRPRSRGDGGEERVDLRGDADVDRVAAGPYAESAQLLGRPLARRGVALGDCDVAARGGELLRDGEAETCAGAGDDCDSALKRSHAGNATAYGPPT